jgi:Protein of unknown function (DUF1573)
MRRNVVTLLLLGVIAWVGSSRALAQDPHWAEKMFERLDQDFGVVPSNADLKARIKITNPHKFTVQISDVRSTCGCTVGKPSTNVLESEQVAWLDVSMDTRRFRGHKEITVLVSISHPVPATVPVRVKAFISSDVALNPGALEFREIPKGIDHQFKMLIDYNGHGQTVIKEAVCKNPHVDVKLNLVRQNSFVLTYELIATLKGTAPIGEFRDQVRLVTTDPNNPQIPVLIEAKIEPEFSVTPEIVSFDRLVPGERKTINVLVRGRKPFMIQNIESEKTAGTFETQIPSDMQKIHRLPLTLIAPSELGTITEEFTVTIKGVAEPVTFKAIGKIVAPGNALPATGNRNGGNNFK